MTKLEEKLIELGYIRTIKSYYNQYKKVYKKKVIIIEIHFHRNNEIVGYIGDCISTQQDIDNLQQAFNTMQKDLEVLKQCQD